MESTRTAKGTLAPIKKAVSISELIHNPRQGDCYVLDLDETLLDTGFDRYRDEVTIHESELNDQINFARKQGATVIALTAREDKSQTKIQLEKLGIKFDEVIHAPNDNREKEKKSTKGKALKSFLQRKVEEGERPKRVIVFDDLNANLKAI